MESTKSERATMDMAAAVAGAAAQGDLADVVARAGAMAAAPPSTTPSFAAAADHMPSSAAMAARQIMVVPCEAVEPRPVMRSIAACSDTSMLEAPSMVDPYLSSSATAPRGASCWLPPPQLAVQISQQHTCGYGRDVAMAGAATDVDGEEAMRISPAAHQIMKRLAS